MLQAKRDNHSGHTVGIRADGKTERRYDILERRNGVLYRVGSAWGCNAREALNEYRQCSDRSEQARRAEQAEAQITREMILDSDAPEWAPLTWDKRDEDEDGDLIEYGAAHVHYWSNATGALGERWCLDCDWLLMPDGTTIQ